MHVSRTTQPENALPIGKPMIAYMHKAQVRAERSVVVQADAMFGRVSRIVRSFLESFGRLRFLGVVVCGAPLAVKLQARCCCCVTTHNYLDCSKV